MTIPILLRHPSHPAHPLRELWNNFRQNRGAVLGLAIVLTLVLLAAFADIVAPHSPIEQFRDATLAPPMWQVGGSSKFVLGTDPVGRDMLSRLIHGARLSLLIGLVSVALSLSFARITSRLVIPIARSGFLLR